MHALTFDSLFKAMPPALIIKPDAPAFTLVDANEAYFKLTGSEPGDIIGKSISEAFPHPTADHPGNDDVIATLHWVIENKRAKLIPTQHYDVPVQGSDQFERRYWITVYSPVLDEKGDLVYICQTALDTTAATILINEDRIALEVAESKRKLLYSLFMQAPVGIGIFLGDKYVVDLINPTLARLYGKSTDELLGKPIFDVLTTAKGLGFEHFLDNVRQTGQPYIGTEAMLPLIRNGQLENIYRNFVYEPFRDESDHIIGVVCIAVDVTNEVLTNRKLRESEQRLNMALLNSEAGVFDTNLITGRTLHSLRNAQIFGYSDNSEEWTVEKFMEHIHPEDTERIKQEYQNSLEHGNVDLKLRIKRTDGVTRWINVVGKHIYDNEHRPVRCVGTTTDITNKTEVERQKDQFISMVSHELKTPLTSIKAYGELIALSLKDDGNKKNREFLDRMQTQISRLEALISDLLDISRIENGKMVLNRSRFEMHTLLAELISDLQLANPTHTLSIINNDEATVFADRDKLIQVITNLVNNAVKYSPKANKVYVSLNCYQNQIVCSIQDFGIGISKDMQTSVFERFHQVDDSKQFSGLGLGLYISREIIHAEGGEIWLESILGQGSIFYFTLPADKTICN